MQKRAQSDLSQVCACEHAPVGWTVQKSATLFFFTDQMIAESFNPKAPVTHEYQMLFTLTLCPLMELISFKQKSSFKVLHQTESQ